MQTKNRAKSSGDKIKYSLKNPPISIWYKITGFEWNEYGLNIRFIELIGKKKKGKLVFKVGSENVIKYQTFWKFVDEELTKEVKRHND